MHKLSNRIAFETYIYWVGVYLLYTPFIKLKKNSRFFRHSSDEMLLVAKR